MFPTAETIQQRVIAYRCCHGNAQLDRRKAMAFGRVKEAASLKRRMWLLDWAISVLCGYHAEEGQCKGQRNSTMEEVCCAMRLADPCCVLCVHPSDPPTPHTCDIAFDHEADEAVEELPDTPDPGVYLVWGSGTIVTIPDEGDPDVVIPDEGSVVSIDGTMWIVGDGVAWPMFPSATATEQETEGLYWLYGDLPQGAPFAGQIHFQGYTSTGGWYDMWIGPTIPAAINLLGLTFHDARLMWAAPNGCLYYSTVTMIPPVDPEPTGCQPLNNELNFQLCY